MAKFVEVFLAQNLPEAYMVKAQLEEAGIPCFVENENLQSALGELPLGMSTSPRILVEESNAKEAVELLASGDSKELGSAEDSNSPENPNDSQ